MNKSVRIDIEHLHEKMENYIVNPFIKKKYIQMNSCISIF